MKILVATDGSEYSTYAVKEFCRLFPNRSNLQIKVVSAYEEQYVLAATPFAPSAEHYQQLADAAKMQAGHFTAAAAEIIRGGDGDLDLTIKIMAGPPEEEIVELAEDWGADLIVVGSHGRGFIGRMIGSVSDSVVHHAPCSVLVIRKPNRLAEKQCRKKCGQMSFMASTILGVDEVERPRAGVGEAVIRVTLTTICGTDLHIVRGEYPVKPGLVIGHEPVGVIEELGEGVSGYEIGDRVLVGAITPCGQCRACLRHNGLSAGTVPTTKLSAVGVSATR